jgi:hypothetical protein
LFVADVTLNGSPYNITGQPVLVDVNMFIRYIGEINDENKVRGEHIQPLGPARHHPRFAPRGCPEE